MNRDEARKILGEGATEEQINNLLTNWHVEESTKIKELESQLSNLQSETSKYSDYDAIKSKLNEIEKANMTEQEKLEEQKKEIERNLSESRIIKNKAKVMEILAGENLDDEIISSLISEDENVTIAKATKMKESLTNLRESVAKQTKEELANINLKPSITNVNQNEQDGMNIDKFMEMSAEDQEKFINENPDEFAKL